MAVPVARCGAWKWNGAMTKRDDPGQDAPPAETLDAALLRQMAEIRREETPERLLVLARELQELLRRQHD